MLKRWKHHHRMRNKAPQVIKSLCEIVEENITMKINKKILSAHFSACVYCLVDRGRAHYKAMSKRSIPTARSEKLGRKTGTFSSGWIDFFPFRLHCFSLSLTVHSLNLYANQNATHDEITAERKEKKKYEKRKQRYWKQWAANQVIIDFRAYKPYHRVIVFFPFHSENVYYRAFNIKKNTRFCNKFSWKLYITEKFFVITVCWLGARLEIIITNYV